VQIKKYIPQILLLVVSAYLLLYNLGGQYLWQDEAETGLISQTILEHGIPKGFDGTNYLTQLEGKILTEDKTYRFHGWLQFYLQSIFFMLFGVSSFTARLPFALVSIGTVFMAYYTARRLWGDNQSALISALALVLSVSFLLLARQSRYYALAMFFMVYALWAFFYFLENKRFAGIHIAVALIGLFYSSVLNSVVVRV